MNDPANEIGPGNEKEMAVTRSVTEKGTRRGIERGTEIGQETETGTGKETIDEGRGGTVTRKMIDDGTMIDVRRGSRGIKTARGGMSTGTGTARGTEIGIEIGREIDETGTTTGTDDTGIQGNQ